MSIGANDYSTPDEEVIFYLDLSTDFTKEKRVRKAIKEFISEYNELHSSVSYGLIMFKKNKEIYSLLDENQEKLLESVSETWEQREKEYSYFENGLYYVLAYVFQKSRTEPKVYRIIVLSDNPSSQTNEYHTALYNLILKCKNFSTYIDIIRLGNQKFYEDDVKLKIIASETFGGVLYCRDDKELKTYLLSLTESRREYSMREITTGEIDKSNTLFYERLATDLISLTSEDTKICLICKEEICQICGKPNDTLHKCYSCNVAFHHCCAAHYSAKNNIGIPYIFRCPNCGALLKIEEKYVLPLFEKDTEEIEKKPRESFLLDEKILAQEKVSINQANIEEELIKKTEEQKEKRIKVGGYFGSEIVLGKDKSAKMIKKTRKSKEMSDTKTEDKKQKISITKLNPPVSNQSVKFCPLCGEAVKGSQFCPKCGSKID
ncbi:MAG: VWA domain-containing protein [Promethearchaeota archaeon]|nr:MAG: VWA domain-containing protein [Candidatus Lokiarchaeota archaeon]